MSDDEFIVDEFHNSDLEDTKPIQKPKTDNAKSIVKPQIKHDDDDEYFDNEFEFDEKPKPTTKKETKVEPFTQPKQNLPSLNKQPIKSQARHGEYGEGSDDEVRSFKDVPSGKEEGGRLKFDSVTIERPNKQVPQKKEEPERDFQKAKEPKHDDELYDDDFNDEKPHLHYQDQKHKYKPQEDSTQKVKQPELNFEPEKKPLKNTEPTSKPTSHRDINRSLDLKASNVSGANQYELQNSGLGSGGGSQMAGGAQPKDQNAKLKQELLILAKACDDALIKEMERRNNRAKEAHKDDDPDLIEKQSEIKEQLAKMEALKNQINIMRRQLENTYNLVKVTEKENEYKAAQRELQKVTSEKEALLKIRAEQNKALDYLKNDNEYGAKLKQATEDLRKAKEENRALNEQANINEKILKKNHERIVDLEEKCREIKAKIQQKKSGDAQEKQEAKKDGKKAEKAEKKKKDFVPSLGNIDVNERVVQELEEKLKELKGKKTIIEKKFEENYRSMEQEKKELQLESAKLQALIKEKEKEVRLNNLRLKEIKKLSRYNSLRPINERNKSVGDVSVDHGSEAGEDVDRARSKQGKKQTKDFKGPNKASNSKLPVQKKDQNTRKISKSPAEKKQSAQPEKDLKQSPPKDVPTDKISDEYYEDAFDEDIKEDTDNQPQEEIEKAVHSTKPSFLRKMSSQRSEEAV